MQYFVLIFLCWFCALRFCCSALFFCRLEVRKKRNWSGLFSRTVPVEEPVESEKPFLKQIKIGVEEVCTVECVRGFVGIVIPAKNKRSGTRDPGKTTKHRRLRSVLGVVVNHQTHSTKTGERNLFKLRKYIS